MERTEIFEKVNEICRDVFEDEDLVVSDSTTAEDVDTWDSLTHLNLICEIEKAYKIKFTMGEIQGFKNVGELVDTVNRRVEKN